MLSPSSWPFLCLFSLTDHRSRTVVSDISPMRLAWSVWSYFLHCGVQWIGWGRPLAVTWQFFGEKSSFFTAGVKVHNQKKSQGFAIYQSKIFLFQSRKKVFVCWSCSDFSEHMAVHGSWIAIYSRGKDGIKVSLCAESTGEGQSDYVESIHNNFANITKKILSAAFTSKER